MILENSTLVYYIPLKTIKCILLNFVTCIWFRSVVEMWKKVIFFHYSHVGNIYSKNKFCYFEARIFHCLGSKVFLLPGHKFPFWNMFPSLATMLLLQFCFSLAMLLIFIDLIVFVTEFDHFVIFFVGLCMKFSKKCASLCSRFPVYWI